MSMFAAYLALAWWAQEFAVTQDGRLSVWYPPPGLVLVVLHLRGLRYWPVAVAAELVGSVLIYDVADDFGTLRTVVNAIGVTGAYALGAAIVRAGLVRPALGRRYDLAWLVLATFLVAAPLAAAIGVGVQQWAGFELDGGFLKAMATWWMGDAIGLLVIAPVGYAVARTAGSGPQWIQRALRRVGIFEVFEAVSVVAMPLAVFMVLDDPYRALYLVLLPVVLVAVRHGAGPGAWAVLASVLTATVAANETEGGTIGRTDLQLLLLVLGMSGNAIGVLERLRRSALGRARELAALFEASPDLVAIVDDHNNMQWVNPAGRALLERTGVDALTLARGGGVVEEDAKESALRRGSWTGTVQMAVGDSSVHLSQMVVALPDEHGRRVGVVARDVTDLHDLTDQLRRLAFTDELTGLANRARLIERLGYALASTEPGAKQSLVLVDIDRFSRLNDHRGHEVGDAALQGVADRLRSVVRSGELLARVGDDRFAVLVENVHDEFAAVSVAERLRAAAGGSWVAELGPDGAGAGAAELSVSAGVVLGGHGDDPDVLLRQADLALQRSKAAGGARSSAYDESLSQLLVDRVRIEVLLREALSGPGWPVRYQPVVDLRSGEVLGCEALLEPLAPPLEVVAVAEELGLIGSLSEHVLRAALDQAVLWRQRKPGFKVGVNVSALQLGDPVLPGRIHHELARAGLPGDALVLEVTETAFTEDAPLANRAAVVLRDMGVQLSIDDFGTGFSSLSRLRSLPVDEIKLDRTFVADIGRTDGAESIIAAVVAMTSALDLKLVAEGIEEEHQRQALVDLGCGVGQGWLFAYPMAPVQFDAWLDSHLVTR